MARRALDDGAGDEPRRRSSPTDDAWSGDPAPTSAYSFDFDWGTPAAGAGTSTAATRGTEPWEPSPSDAARGLDAPDHRGLGDSPGSWDLPSSGRYDGDASGASWSAGGAGAGRRGEYGYDSHGARTDQPSGRTAGYDTAGYDTAGHDTSGYDTAGGSAGWSTAVSSSSAGFSDDPLTTTRARPDWSLPAAPANSWDTGAAPGDEYRSAGGDAAPRQPWDTSAAPGDQYRSAGSDAAPRQSGGEAAARSSWDPPSTPGDAPAAPWDSPATSWDAPAVPHSSPEPTPAARVEPTDAWQSPSRSARSWEQPTSPPDRSAWVPPRSTSDTAPRTPSGAADPRSAWVPPALDGPTAVWTPPATGPSVDRPAAEPSVDRSTPPRQSAPVLDDQLFRAAEPAPQAAAAGLDVTQQWAAPEHWDAVGPSAPAPRSSPTEQTGYRRPDPAAAAEQQWSSTGQPRHEPVDQGGWSEPPVVHGPGEWSTATGERPAVNATGRRVARALLLTAVAVVAQAVVALVAPPYGGWLGFIAVCALIDVAIFLVAFALTKPRRD